MRSARAIAQVAAQRKPEIPTAPFTFGGWRYGWNGQLPADQILDQEAAAIVNFRKTSKTGGQWYPRDGIVENTTTAVNGGVAHRFVPIAGTVVELLVDSDKKLYYNSAGTPTRIGGSRLLSSTSVFIFAFKGVALICDGGYLKYCDGTGATGLKIAYDNGTGTNGHQYNNITGTQDSVLALGNGTNTRIAQKITTQAWDTGFTIPPTIYKFYASKNGSPTGAITLKLRAVSDDSILASVTAYADVSELTGDAELVEVAFQSGTVTTEMSPSTAYYASLEYSGGDGSNYVEIHCTDLSSGGLAFYYDGSWNADATANLVCSLRPGRPPKAMAGEVFDNSPWIIDPDNQGGAWEGFQTYLDFSTSGYAGFIGVEDDDVNTFKVSAIKSIWDGLYFWGTTGQPYIAKLSGTAFANFTITRTYQKQWTTKRLLTDTIDDIWFVSKNGVDALFGIQEFGDLETRSYSDQIKKVFDAYFDPDTDHVAYDTTNGQVLVQMMNYHRLLVFNKYAATPMQSDGTDRVRLRYPISEYEFTMAKLSDTNLYSQTDSGSGTNETYFLTDEDTDPAFTGKPDFVMMDGRILTEGTAGSLADHEWDYGDNDALGFSTIYIRDDSGDLSTTNLDLRTLMVPQTMEHYNGNTYFFFSDGLTYKYDSSEYKDLSENHMTFKLLSKEMVAQLGLFNITAHQFSISGTYGAQLNLHIYTDHQTRNYTARYSYALPLDDNLDLVDMTMDLVDAYFSLSPTMSPPWSDMEINARSFQVGISDLLLSGGPVYINNVSFLIRKLPK